MISDVKHLFLCMLTICISFGEKKCVFNSLPIFYLDYSIDIELYELFMLAINPLLWWFRW